METTTFSKQKTTEFVIWLIGILGIFYIILNQNSLAKKGFVTKEYFPYILIVSMILVALSLFLKLNRERKFKNFTFANHIREIIRTVGALGFAIYALSQN